MSDLIYAYADESGDAGYQFHASSSARFVIAMVIPADAEVLIDKMLAIRRQLGKSAVHEFHFRQTDDKERSAFFSTIRHEPMQIFVAVIQKQLAPPNFQKLGKQGLHNHAIAGLCLRSPVPLHKCKLHLDGSGKQVRFLSQLKTAIRYTCRSAGRPEQNLKDIRVLDSGNPLIQCADMITGAASERAEYGRSIWMDMLTDKVVVSWEENFK